MTTIMQDLQPRFVWAHFSTLCSIPHPSYKEAALRARLIEWAKGRGIESVVDGTGNLILKKPASPGCERAPGVILQGHLDMVCQANSGVIHDFERDAIKVDIESGWVLARDTTLGADNGIGVALALAVLEEPDLAHPSIEVLLTVNEESGMDGARGLAPGTLRGKYLLNLDSEEWGYFYLGCAGGVDVEVRHDCAWQQLPSGYEFWRLDLAGLRGGHSGIDIHLPRGNAIKLLAEVMRDLAGGGEFALLELSGGTARNAIPREAYAVFAIQAHDAEKLQGRVEKWQLNLRRRFGADDANISLTCAKIDQQEGRAITRDERDSLLAFIESANNGVAAMNEDFPQVVDTSSNLGVANLLQGKFSATFKVRSLSDSRADELAEKIVFLASGYGFESFKDGAYPGWTPNPHSQLLELCLRVHEKEFGQAANLQVIHAGLECGLLAASHPNLQMISFGPDIRGAHAPGERVEIESVARTWSLLKAVLQELARQQ